MAFATAAVLAASVLAPTSAAATSPAVIVYQCPDGAHICAISPSGGSPRQLSQTGTLAGVTSDGTRYGYAAPSAAVPGHQGLYEAPVAGGAPTEVNSNALAADLDPPVPVMSADGSTFLEHRDQAGYFSTPDTDDIFRFSVSAGPASQPSVVDSSTRFGMTYGWLGDTTITTHTAGVDLQPPSWACIGYVPNGGEDFCSNTDPHAKLQSATSTIDFPDGSPNGSEIVAIVGAPGQAGGSIALFSAVSGAMTATVAVPPAGSEYTAPRFSPNGSQIVFESDPASGGTPSIETVNTTGGQPTTLAQGGNPFWGGAATTGSSTLPLGPKVKLAVPRQSLSAARHARRLVARCTLSRAGMCTVTLTITARTARRLKLKLASAHARTATLAAASRRLRHKGTVTLSLKLSRRTLVALRHTKRLQITVTATSTRTGQRARRITRTITLHA